MHIKLIYPKMHDTCRGTKVKYRLVPPQSLLALLCKRRRTMARACWAALARRCRRGRGPATDDREKRQREGAFSTAREATAPISPLKKCTVGGNPKFPPIVGAHGRAPLLGVAPAAVRRGGLRLLRRGRRSHTSSTAS